MNIWPNLSPSAGAGTRHTHRVAPAKAGAQIPETAVWGTMGPRFRGDDGTN
jgi:hypothetical protein